VAARILVGQDRFTEVRIGDLNPQRAREVAAALGAKARPVGVDASDLVSLRRAMAGADLVLNCTGPFFKLAAGVFEAARQLKLAYVDVCDDVDATRQLLELDGAARAAGMTALIGMGSSPGVTNLLAKLAAEAFLDETDSIDIFHAHGGEPLEGAGVIGHHFHNMTVEIPVFLDGELRQVSFFGPEGVALRQEFELPVLGKVTLFPHPHPEQITLPRSIRCRRVTNKGTVLPEAYYELIRETCRLGFDSQEPLEVKGHQITPRDFSIAYILREREKLLAQSQFGEQRGCLSVIVKGRKDGQAREYRFHLASRSQSLGEATGVPAAIGVLLIAEGKVQGPGVLTPEAAVAPMDFLGWIPKVMTLDADKEGGRAFGGIILEQIDEDGQVTRRGV
jgi:saccharopine dehydrogenase (NAD+, L-lysine-forming)